MTDRTELEVVLDQLDEMLASGVDHADEAIEIAGLAGMAERLGAPKEALAEAVEWREGFGAGILEDAWDDMSFDDLVEVVDDCTSGGQTELTIEDAILDVDEVVVAAVWCGVPEHVRELVERVEELIRLVPDVFAFLAPDAEEALAEPLVAQNMGSYGYWVAIRDAGVHAEN